MAEPKKPQKTGRSANRNANKATITPTELKPKRRDKYKSDVPLQSNQVPARAQQNMNSLRAEGDWFESAEKAMKGLGILRPPKENTLGNKPQEQDRESTPEIMDADFEEGEVQMSQEEIDDAYSKYLKHQWRQDEEMDEAMVSNLESEMWSIASELKNRKKTPSSKKMGFFKNWLKCLMELADDKDTNKPIEPTIAYLAETNAYLTRKLNELEANPTHTTRQQPHDPTTQATPMATNSRPSWEAVAAAPVKSTQKTSAKPSKPTQTRMTPQEPTADPRCLIIQVQPPILAKEKPNGIVTRKKINEMLDKKGVLQFFHVMAVGYSGAGNIKITTMHTSKVSDLMQHRNDIASIITNNKVLSILPDTEHYQVKINKVLTWCGNNEPMSIDLIHEELCMYLQGYKSMKQWRVP